MPGILIAPCWALCDKRNGWHHLRGSRAFCGNIDLDLSADARSLKTSLGTDPLPGVDGSAPLELLARTRASSRTIASAIAGWAARDGAAPALVSVGSQQVTFSELAALVDRFA